MRVAAERFRRSLVPTVRSDGLAVVSEAYASTLVYLSLRSMAVASNFVSLLAVLIDLAASSEEYASISVDLSVRSEAFT